MESTVDRLRSVLEGLLSERSEVRAEIDDLESKKRDLRTSRRESERLESRIASAEDELEERRERVEELSAEIEEIEAEIEECEEAVAELQRDEYDELLDLHREANELEFELDSLEDDLSSIESEIDDIEDRLAEREDIEARRDEAGEELTELRTRIDRIEADAVEAFNTHMEQVLEVLEYDNLDRIWIERIETGGGQPDHANNRFDLHVVRSTDDGSVYEDTVDHLSESEREVTGLIFALAGYLVHDVHEVCPFMLLDSLEAIDADRIATLIDYLEEFPEYLIVALLPGDAKAVEVEHERITQF